MHYLSLDESSGYAHAARAHILALADAGVDVRWVPFRVGRGWGLGYEPAVTTSGDTRLLDLTDTVASDDVVVAHLTPEYYPRVRAQHPAAHVVGHTVWETDRLPHHWLDLLEVPDLLVVPCRWNAEVIRASGVRTPVAVVPHITELPDPTTTGPGPDIDPDAFAFYAIGDWTTRKNVGGTIRAYLAAFTAEDPVALVVKTSWRDLSGQGGWPTSALDAGTTARAVAALLAEGRDNPTVHVIVDGLDDAAVAGMHARGDCLVSLCRSEGWGLTLAEAAAWGNPIAVTGYGGHLDFLDHDTAFLVDHELVAVHDPAGKPSYTPDQHWAEPSVVHAADVLRAIASDPVAAGERGRAARARIADRYQPATVAAVFLAALRDRV